MAYPPGNKFFWNGIAVHLAMPASGETVNTGWFSVPGGTKVLQVFIPSMVGTGTIKLQALAPTENVEATQVWRDVTVFDLTDGSFEAIDALPEQTCVTVPVSATGGGNLRFVASEDQSGTPSVIEVFCSRDG